MAVQILSTLDDSLRLPNTEPFVALDDGSIRQGPEPIRAGGIALSEGAKAWLASHPNTRPQDNYQGKNFDNAVIMKLPPVEVPVPDILSEALLYAGNFITNQMTKNNWRGGTTGTAAWFDPKKNTLDISSIGDSPVFIVFHDGKKGVTVQVNDRQDETTAAQTMRGERRVTASLHAYNNPPRPAQWNLGNGTPAREGTLHIDALKKDIGKEFGLNLETLEATLLVASDGIDFYAKHAETPNRPNVFQGELPDMVHETLKFAGHNCNRASEIAHAATRHEENRGAYYDDVTVAVLPLKQTDAADSGPIVVFIADGMSRNGKECSYAAASAFTGLIEAIASKASAIAAKQWTDKSLLNHLTSRPIDPSGIRSGSTGFQRGTS